MWHNFINAFVVVHVCIASILLHIMSGFYRDRTSGYTKFIRGPPVYASGRKVLYPRLVNRHKGAYKRLGLSSRQLTGMGRAARSIGGLRRRKRGNVYRAANTIKRLFRATRARGKRPRFGVRS